MLSESCFRPVADEVRDVDRLIFQSGLVAVGQFRCPRSHPRFNDSGAIRDHCFVFPRTSVVIEHDTGDRFVGDQARVALYNAGQAYRRHPVSPDGDHCDYFVVAAPVLREALAGRGLSTADADERGLFPRSSAPSDSALYLRQRLLFRSVRDHRPDAFEVESTVLSLLDEVLGGLDERGGRTPAMRARQLRLVEDTRALIALRYADALSLRDLADDVGVSAYHLCRVFRAHTGQSLHRHRDQLRLRAALNRLERDEDLTTIALDVGYSSHSHFTSAFRRAFGVAPSAVRRS